MSVMIFVYIASIARFLWLKFKVCSSCPVMTKTSQSRRSLPHLPLAAPPVRPYPGVESASSSSPAPLPSSLIKTPFDVLVRKALPREGRNSNLQPFLEFGEGNLAELKEITAKLTAISTVVAEQNSVFGQRCQIDSF